MLRLTEPRSGLRRTLRKPFARLVPPDAVNGSGLVKPDIMARLKETWGDRIFSAKEVAAMRAAELDGEEG